MDTANAVLDRVSQWRFGILEYLEHLSVVLEHEREQLSNAEASGDVKEMLQEQRRRASMLIVVGNDESHLRIGSRVRKPGSNRGALRGRKKPAA